jgi:triacylglycerol lipase
LSKVVKSSLITAGFLIGVGFLAMLYAMTLTIPAIIGSGAVGWLWGVRLLNVLAPRMPLLAARTVYWLHAMTFECLALLGVALFRFIPRQSALSGKGKPILLVHGYVNNGSVWRFQKSRLEKAGLGPIYTIDLGHPFRSIQEYADKVKAKAQEIALETGRKDLILIGHSMGGLVSALYATTLAPPDTVTDVITIGSPLVGTPMARLGLGLNAREMRRGSILLKNLQVAIANTPRIRFHHIATTSDQLVIPGRSAIIATNNYLLLDDIGHASLLYSRRVTQKILEWLK